MTVCDPDAKIYAQVGGENPVLPGNFVAPHGIWADKKGDFYVGEVVVNAGAVKRMAPLKPAGFRSFAAERDNSAAPIVKKPRAEIGHEEGSLSRFRK